METITLLSTIPAVAYIIVYVVWPFFKVNPGKPFGCVPCLSMWLFFLVAIFVSPESCIFAPTAYIIGAILDRYVV